MSTETDNRMRGSITTIADLLQAAIQSSPLVKEWTQDIPNGTNYTDPWIMREVSPVNIIFNEKALQVYVHIATRGGEALVTLKWPFKSWRDGLTEVGVIAALQKAIDLCEYCWNHHIMQEENAYPNVRIDMEV